MPNQFTIVVSHFLKEGKEQAFEEALKQVIQKAMTYEGYEGIQVIRPNSAANNEYPHDLSHHAKNHPSLCFLDELI